MITKKIKYKDAAGTLHEYDIGADAKNVSEDENHQFVTAEEKEAWNNKQDGDGDASSLPVKFQQASTRANIKTGEKLGTVFGKIAKWFADFKSHVFLDLVQNATTKDTTRAVSAAVAAELQKQIDSLSSSLLFENVVDSKNGSSFNRNLLTIGTEDRTERLKRAYFAVYKDEIDQWTNIPPGLITTTVSVCLREVFWFSSSVVMVKITELHPKPGTIYYRTYNTDKWNEDGWKVVSPT